VLWLVGKTVASSWHRLDGNTTDGTTCNHI